MMDKPTMICGLDVYHKTKEGRKSVLAFVASMNNQCSRFYTSTEVHETG